MAIERALGKKVPGVVKAAVNFATERANVEYVRGPALPKDFAAIPDDSPKENVKASVPGTHQALEAAIANGIPSTVKVDRKKATMDPAPQYDGPPRLEPISGTPLRYVINCPTPVFKVDTNAWYACQNGVWFVAAEPPAPGW